MTEKTIGQVLYENDPVQFVPWEERAQEVQESYEEQAHAVAAVVREQCAQACEGRKVGLPSYFEIDERIQECADDIRSMKP